MSLPLLLVFAAAATATPEEQALRALLEDRSAAAVRTLEAAADDDPVLRWIAGRVALASGDLRAARRLLDGERPADRWGQVDLLIAEGTAAEAARRALSEMDDALAGRHREALARLLLDQADARAERDPASAGRMLRALLALEASEAMRTEAEDALFRLVSPDGGVDTVIAEAAFRRLEAAEAGGALPARLVAGIALAGKAPLRAHHHLVQVAAHGERDLSVKAATVASRLALPPPHRLAVLDAVAERFSDEEALSRLRLALAAELALMDEAAGTAALEALVDDPFVGSEAAEAQALTTSDPTRRRARFLALAEREGRSPRGDRARAQARAALLAAVAATAEGAPRVVAARAALDTADGTGAPELLFAALPDDGARLPALWALAERFDDGPWCAELARRLVSSGADAEVAARFGNVCPTATGPDASGFDRSAALHVLGGLHGDGETWLALKAGSGTLEVLAAGADRLRVTQNPVDPEVLFRASGGHPLDTEVHAFLVSPDASWSIDVDAGRVVETSVTPRGRGLLTALTVRAGERQATALVPRKQLEVQAVRDATRLAVAVTDAGAPVRGARLLVLDGSGRDLEARTGRDGVAVFEDLKGDVRIMARTRDGLGFAEAGTGAAPSRPQETVTLVAEARSAPVDGGPVRIRVFVARPGGGDGEGEVVLRSISTGERLLEERTVTLEGGTATAELFVQGGGRVEARRGDLETRRVAIPADSAAFPVAIAFSPPVPSPGDDVTVRLDPRTPLPEGGLGARLVVTTPWRSETHDLLLEGGPFTLPVPLSDAAPGEGVRVTLQLASGGRAEARTVVARPPAPPPPRVPPLALAGADLGEADTWRVARHGSGTTVIWAAPGDSLVLPASILEAGTAPGPATGTWSVSAWAEGEESAAVTVQVLSPDDALAPDGTWRGPGPLLRARLGLSATDVRLVDPGEGVGEAAPDGWIATAAADHLAVPPSAHPHTVLDAGGVLARGGSATLTLGDRLPEGSRLWAVLRDASDARAPAGAIAMQHLSPAPRGGAASPWSPMTFVGERMAAALLAEEERLAERGPMQRIALDATVAASERADAGVGGLGLLGAGRGGGGLGHAGHPGVGVARPTVTAPAFFAAADPLAVLEAAAPGPWSVTTPPWVTAAEIDLVARLPDGSWHRAVRRVAVDGPPPGPIPEAATTDASETWDGTLAALRAVALTLPIDARVHALAALVDAGDAPSGPPLLAARGSAGTGQGRSLAAFLGHADPSSPAAALSRLEGLPDPRRVERALAALEASAGAPDLAASAARRLLRDGTLPDWVRSRAALALLVARQRDEALAALVGETPIILAARAIAGAPLPDEQAPILWALARSEAAHPNDRAMALHALATRPGRPVAASARAATADPLPISVMPPLVAFRGETFGRGARLVSRTTTDLAPVDRIPTGRLIPVVLDVGPSEIPSRVRCPAGDAFVPRAGWLDVEPSTARREVTCLVEARREGNATVTASWHAPDGAVLASGSVDVVVTEPRAASPGDPMSPDERFAFGVALAENGLPGAAELLTPLLAEPRLASRAVVRVSEALLADARREGEPAALVAAFEAARERSRQSSLDLETAAAVAHAYARTDEPERAVAAARAVLDARFREELGAVRAVQESGLAFVALLLLQELKARYPEGETVAQARYLAPSLLLERAAGDGDRMGYTRTSLRHSAAADLARFLLVHPDHASAPEAAILLAETLRLLRDPVRERAIAGALVHKYGATPTGWRLSIAEARARFATGDLAGAARVLDAISVEGAAASLVALERGRIAEARGRTDEALESYRASRAREAAERAAWLERAELDPEPLLVLRRGDRRTVDASLAPGTRVDVSATRIVLEHLLLRDGGDLDPTGAVVDGLAAERTVTVRADASGELPLPRLGEGAWLVSATLEGEPRRFLVLRSDLSMEVRSGHGHDALVQLRDHRGRPVKDASLWVFGHETATATTDALGAAWLPGAAGAPVLARVGDAYAFWQPPQPDHHHPARRHHHRPAARPAYDFDDDAIGGLLQKNVSAYESMYIQDRVQTISADAF